MVYNRYLLIRRWKEIGAPESIKKLESGAKVKLVDGNTFMVDRVGIDRVLLVDKGWVDWREIEQSIRE